MTPRAPRRRLAPALLGLLLGCHQTQPPIPPEGPAARLHHDAFVADLHADPTLWNADILADEDRQASLPALQRGGVDAVVFGIPTQGLPIIGGWRIFAAWRGFPVEARRGHWAAATHQIDAIHAAAEASAGRLRVVRTAAEARAAREAGALAAFIGVEGGHAVEGDLARLATLKERGVFYVGPIHLSDNALGGSSFELGPMGPGEGLTDLGRAFVLEAERLGLVLDLAHASPQAVDEILASTRGPVMVSHTGIGGVHEMWRNLSDAQLRAVAARGGVVGVMFGNHYLGGDTVDVFVDHVAHAIAVMGARHVALGTDFDGMVPLPQGISSAADLPRLTQVMLDRGLSEEDIRLVLGGSFLGFLDRISPPPPAAVPSPLP